MKDKANVCNADGTVFLGSLFAGNNLGALRGLLRGRLRTAFHSCFGLLAGSFSLLALWFGLLWHGRARIEEEAEEPKHGPTWS